MSKTEAGKENWILGDEVHKHLVSLGLETPMVDDTRMDFATEGEEGMSNRKAQLEHMTAQMMNTMGLDLKDDSLEETPKRVAKMWINELMWGLDYSNFPKVTVVENKIQYDEMVLERNITVQSMCEHHLLPILGTAHVAYIPTKKVPGLSKINRVVDFFCRRPQIQERLTAQIYHTLCYLLDSENVAVCITAEHLCVKMRGVQDACSDTVTSKLGGDFRSHGGARREFFNLINVNK